MGTGVTIPDFLTVTIGFAVFLLGAQLNGRVAILQRLNIPEPVSGGLVAALAGLGIYLSTGTEITFELQSRDYFLVLFFAAIGLNARLADLISGGKPLAVLLVLTLLTILMQNLVGIGGASLFGYPPQVGVLMGSAALIGGHGTAIAWAPEVGAVTSQMGMAELGTAVATLGLVLAAVVGGPVAGLLIRRHNLSPARPDEENTVGLPHDRGDAVPIDHLNLMRVMLYLNLSVIAGFFLGEVITAFGLKLPLFVPCLIVGIIIANLRSLLFPHAAPVSRTPALALVSEFALGAFLAISLMSLQLWTIAGLGLAILAVLVVQTLFTVIFVIYVLFPLLGRGYRAAVLAAGFAGFSLGATPTAIANMTAVTKRFGPSPIAFVVLPLVSAFFVDIANAIVIQAILNF